MNDDDDESAVETLNEIRALLGGCESKEMLEAQRDQARANESEMRMYSETVKRDSDRLEQVLRRKLAKLEEMALDVIRGFSLLRTPTLTGCRSVIASRRSVQRSRVTTALLRQPRESPTCEACPEDRRKPATRHLCQEHWDDAEKAATDASGLACEVCPKESSEIATRHLCEKHVEALTWTRVRVGDNALEACRHQLGLVEDELRAKRNPALVPLILNRPQCHARHIDRGEFATRLTRPTHARPVGLLAARCRRHRGRGVPARLPGPHMSVRFICDGVRQAARPLARTPTACRWTGADQAAHTRRCNGPIPRAHARVFCGLQAEHRAGWVIEAASAHHRPSSQGR